MRETHTASDWRTPYGLKPLGRLHTNVIRMASLQNKETAMFKAFRITLGIVLGLLFIPLCIALVGTLVLAGSR